MSDNQAHLSLVPSDTCPTGDCGEERAVLDITSAREFASLLKEAQKSEPNIDNIAQLIEGARLIIDALCDELTVRNRHLGRYQDMLDRLETRMVVKDDNLLDERYLTTVEIRSALLGTPRLKKVKGV